jgi:hypothetical protein
MSVPFDPNATAAPAANTAAVVTFASVEGRSHVIWAIEWSYSAGPTGGSVTITDGGVVMLQLDITAGGPGSILFEPPKKAYRGNAVVVTLAAGGAGISGKLNVAHTLEV